MLNGASAIGERIKEWRTAKGWSQGQLAFFSGVRSSHLSLIERGMRNPKVETLVKIADAFKRSYVELVDGIEGYPSSEGVESSTREDGGEVGAGVGEDRSTALRDAQINLRRIGELNPEDFDVVVRVINAVMEKTERKYLEEHRAKRNRRKTSQQAPADNREVSPS
jgi:transcriptional regulator with XRE-family HTH domain